MVCEAWSKVIVAGSAVRRASLRVLEDLDAALEFRPKFLRRLHARFRFLLQHLAQDIDDARGQHRERFKGRHFVEMLGDDAGHRTHECGFAGEHVPQGDAEGVNVRPDILGALVQLLRAGKVRRADKSAGGERAGGGADEG